jgi:diadenylate cyclase
LSQVGRFVIQVGLLAFVIYAALQYLQGTRAARILVGILITTVAGWFLSQILGLEVVEWLLGKVPALLAFAVLIIFQPELRRLFADIGVNPHRLTTSDEIQTESIEKIIDATYFMAERKIGALMAVERDIGMRAYAESGVAINAPVSSELLITVFYPNTPLHDGAVIIKDGVIVAASVFFQLTQAHLSRTLGTRHRAGIGITEETDAVVIIVSEETGTVSLAHKGRLVREVDADRMRRHLKNYLIKKAEEKKPAKKAANS